MLGMKDAALVGISTPLDSTNWLSQAVTVMDENGLPYFHVTQVGLVCQACYKTGRVDMMNQCPHEANRTPSWKAGDREKRIREITSRLDDPARGIFAAITTTAVTRIEFIF
jgi:hypothetical protein